MYGHVSMTKSSAILAWPDFRTLFESAPGSYLVLTPALVIVAMSDTYLRAAMTGRGRFWVDISSTCFQTIPRTPPRPEFRI
jgi:hypothetical protein